jgi:hypothetical protein
MAKTNKRKANHNGRFYGMDRYECVEMEVLMVKLNEFSHNQHPPRVKILAKNISRGISVIVDILLSCFSRL